MVKSIKSHFELTFFFLKVYFLMVLSMLSIRFYFVYRNSEYIKEKIPSSTYIKGFFIGWVYDNAIISYIILIMVVLFLFYFIFHYLKFEKIGKFLMLFPVIIMQAIVYVTSVLDVQYFNEFGFHMNSSISDYKSNNKEIIATFFNKEYSPFTNIALIILIIILNIFLIRIFLKDYEKKKKYTFSVHIINVLTSILLIVLCVVGARGGIGSVPLSWGRAYFSPYEFTNQMTLNGAYNLGKSYYYQAKKVKEGAVPKIYSLQESGDIVKDLIKAPNETFLNKKNPLLREVVTGKKEEKINVVLVIMESWLSYGIKSMGGEKELTPNFDKLAKDGVLFKNFYAVGGRSSRGITSVHVSYPSPLDEAVTKDVIASQESFLSMGNILKERKYNTSFIYGGDAHFDNMHGFLRKNGIDNILDVTNFDEKDKTIKWGVPDDKLFDFGLKYMDRLKEPFFVNLYTLSNHGPYDTDPNYQFNKTDKNDEMFLKDRAYSFSDYALGQFMDNVKSKKYANNTIFLFVADHGTILKKFKTNDPRFFHTPFLIWSPNKNLVKAEVIEKIGSQVDVIPTLMNYLGGNYLSGSWGQDLMLENKSNYAFVSNGDAYGIIDKNNYYYISKLEGENLLNKDTLSPISDENLKTEYRKTLNGHIDLMFYQREQGIFGNK